MIPFAPVWDVYYYTSPPLGRLKGNAARNTLRDCAKHSARLRTRAARPGGIYRGQGGRVVVNGAPLLALSGTLPYSRVPYFWNIQIFEKQFLAQNSLNNRFGWVPSRSESSIVRISSCHVVAMCNTQKMRRAWILPLSALNRQHSLVREEACGASFRQHSL